MQRLGLSRTVQSSEVGLGTCFLICWCSPRASPLVSFPAADVEMSLHFCADADVVRECWKADGRASKLWEAVWGAAWVAELCPSYLFSGHWVPGGGGSRLSYWSALLSNSELDGTLDIQVSRGDASWALPPTYAKCI